MGFKMVVSRFGNNVMDPEKVKFSFDLSNRINNYGTDPARALTETEYPPVGTYVHVYECTRK